MNKIQWRMDSKMGPLYLVASDAGICSMGWSKQDIPTVRTLRGRTIPIRFLSLAAAQIRQYLNGERKSFTVPFDLNGTPFQKTVWNELSLIPYGQTCSYRDIAIRLGNPNSTRAVGSANGKNPICILIPCHRVIASNGGLGGYSGGLKRKSLLLTLETGEPK